MLCRGEGCRDKTKGGTEKWTKEDCAPSPVKSAPLGIEPPFKMAGAGRGIGWEWAEALIRAYLRPQLPCSLRRALF